MKTKILKLFKKDTNGNEIPWYITIDDRSVVQDERLGLAAINRERTALDSVPDTQRKYVEDLQARGISFEMDPTTNSILITAIPPLEQELGKFFLLDTPCDFPECVKLREEWSAALQALQASSDENCDNRCAEGKLRRQFMEKVRPYIRINEPRDSTRNTEVSAPKA